MKDGRFLRLPVRERKSSVFSSATHDSVINSFICGVSRATATVAIFGNGYTQTKNLWLLRRKSGRLSKLRKYSYWFRLLGVQSRNSRALETEACSHGLRDIHKELILSQVYLIFYGCPQERKNMSLCAIDKSDINVLRYSAHALFFEN